MLASLALALIVGTASPLWSYTTTDAPGVTGIYRDTVIVGFYGLYHNGHTDVRTEGIDAPTGKVLWRRKNAAPITGGIPLLAVGRTIERVDARTGKSLWRSAKLCDEDSRPTAGAVLVERTYIGCSDGTMFALRDSTGRVSASAQAISMHIDHIVPLAFGTLRVSGSDADASRSAIVNGETLKPVIAEAPDLSFLGYDGDTILMADTCCRGQHEDNWPATIRRFSRLTGKEVSSTDLHPYQPSLPMDTSQPGGGSVLLAGTKLYVLTHSALFQFDTRRLQARPRLLYGNLAGGIAVVENRYFAFRDAAGRVSLFDTRTGRIAWSNHSEAWELQLWAPELGATLALVTAQQVHAAVVRLSDMTLWRIDGSCWLIQATTEHLALTYCPGPGGIGPVRPSRLQMYKLQN